MKNNLLVALAIASVAPAFAQNQVRRKVMKASRPHAMKEQSAPLNRPIAVVTNPSEQQLSPSVFTWTNIAESINMYGFLTDGQKPLHYNPYVKAVSFLHRKGPGFTAAPANNSGAIVARVTTDWGATWDSTCLYSDANNPGRFPQGAIYSAPGNTVLSNAYVVGTGPVLDANSNWAGGWAASKQLGAGNYNNTASAAPNAMQVLPNSPPYNTAVGKIDNPCYSFATTADGKVRSLGYLCDDFNSSTNINLRGSKLLTGTFNAGTFNWSADSMVVSTVKRSDSSKHIGGTPIMAWSQDGTIGYVITIGVRSNATGSNRGYQPIIHKTINSGASWSLINGIDFSTPTFSNVLKQLSPINNSTVVAPQFNSGEGIDATVDMNGKLHIATTLISTASSDNDSLDNWNAYTSENYHWDYTPGNKPYLYDFYGDGTGPWKYITVDTITSEGPGDQASVPGYADNPWLGDGTVKARSASRIQLGRTPDGKYVVYSWAESNPAFTTNGKHWNNLPEIKVRMMDVNGGYVMSPTKYNVTPGGTPVNGKAMFHFIAPVVSPAVMTSTSVVSFTTPVTASNNMNFDDLNTVTHWYTAAALSFTLGSSVGINEHVPGTSAKVSLFPNPAKDNVSVTIDLKENSNVAVAVYDLLGRAVKTVNTNAAAGSNTIELDVRGLTTGVYMVNIKAGNASTTKKLIIE